MVPLKLLADLRVDASQGARELAAYSSEDTDNQFVIAKRIHDWIRATVAYDYDRFSGRIEGEVLPSETLRAGKATCGGFSKIFALIAESAGIEVITIPGFSKAYIKQTGDSCMEC